MSPIQHVKALHDNITKMRAERAKMLLRHKAELFPLDQEISAADADLSTALATAAQKEEA